jgi:UDP-N-acetyl-D-glucosamine dehydrogenase
MFELIQRQSGEVAAKGPRVRIGLDIDARTVAVIGLGYVGLPTALAIFSAGARVVGFDVSSSRLSAIREGRVDVLPIDARRLECAVAHPDFFLTDRAVETARAEAVLICVPTPVDARLVPDLSALSAACATIVRQASVGQLIILTSTSYVGTTRDLLIKPLEAVGFCVGENVFVAFSPERIDPANADFPQQSVPRVVGGVTSACAERAPELLASTASSVHVVSSPETAELTKLYENTFRAVNLALANEISEVAGSLRLDVSEVIAAANTKPYGFMPFYSGPGVGGHCVPCDPHYLLWQLKSRRVSVPLIEHAMVSIAERPHRVADRARIVLADTGCAMRACCSLVWPTSQESRTFAGRPRWRSSPSCVRKAQMFRSATSSSTGCVFRTAQCWFPPRTPRSRNTILSSSIRAILGSTTAGWAASHACWTRPTASPRSRTGRWYSRCAGSWS